MADSSLDDIIKQKRMQRFGAVKQQQNKKGGNQKQLKGNQNRVQGNKKGRLFREVQKDLGIKTKPLSINTDARNKIIQKQRIKFKDARDRLAQIAKQGDARDKLNKMRKTKPGGKVIPQQKAPVVKKKNVNVPKPQLVKTGGQTAMKGAAVVRTVPGGNRIRKKNLVVRGKPAIVKKTFVTKGNKPTGRTHPLANNPSVITIKNNRARPYETYEVVDYDGDLDYAPQPQSFLREMPMQTTMDTMFGLEPEPVIRSRPGQVIYAREYEPEVRPSRLRITAANSEYRVGGQYDDWQESWEPAVRVQPRKREYVDDEYTRVYPKKIAVAHQPVQVEAGTKVVVSNLHPCVSVEDMEELLGTVGSVSSVRMVRQGVAEAFFVNQEDAYRSVELFNNRQLDGQPMKVMVVRKKAPLMNNPPVQARSVLKNARGRSGYYV